MIQVLEDFSPQSQRAAALSKLMSSIGQGAERLHGFSREKKERQALKNIFGDVFENVHSPEVRKELLTGTLKKQQNTEDKLRKLTDLENIKKSPYWNKASDLEKFAIEREILGDITGQTAKSLINLQREQNLGDDFKKYLLETGQMLSDTSFASLTEGKIPQLDSGISQDLISSQRLPEDTKPKGEMDWMDNLSEKKLAVYAGSPNKQISDHANSLLDFKQKQKDFQFKEKKFELEPKRKGVESFFNRIAEQRQSLPQAEISYDAMLQGVYSGATDPFSASHLIEIGKTLGVPETLLRPLQTTHGKEFDSARKNAFSNILRSAFRGTTTKREIEIADSMLAQAGNKQSANEASIYLLQAGLMISKEEDRIQQMLSEQGISNFDIPDSTEKMLQPYIKMIKDQYLEAVKELAKQ